MDCDLCTQLRDILQQTHTLQYVARLVLKLVALFY